MILYKYTTRAGMKMIVTGASLLVRPLKEYNDPFESVPAVSDAAVRFIANKVFQNSESLEQLVAEATPMKLAKSFQDLFSHSIGLVCLTKNPANILMWSHYAEEHHGYVFSIDTSLWNPDAVQVIYSKHRVPFPLDPQTDADLLPVFMTKSLDWEYEQEYRILCKVDSWETVRKKKQDCFALNPNQIKWICAGVRTPKENIKNLRIALKDSLFPNTQVYQASLHPSKFGIELPKACTVPA